MNPWIVQLGRALAASCLVLVFAAVLYPWVRRWKLGRLFFLGLSSVLAFAALLMAEDAWKFAADGVIGYIAGIFCAVILLSVLIDRGSRWLYTPSAGHAPAAGKSGPSRVHLRHLLQAGAMWEEQGRDFYLKIAYRAVDPDVREMCSFLAGQETAHQQYLEGILARWMVFDPSDRIRQLLKERAGDWGIFRNAPSEEGDTSAWARYALDQERRMGDFYASLEKEFPEQWKRLQIRIIVDQERAHYDRLSAWIKKKGL
ncbi:MAG: ferritin-like domain-containing protein [Deltaproteobacteria bacterium]